MQNTNTNINQHLKTLLCGFVNHRLKVNQAKSSVMLFDSSRGTANTYKTAIPFVNTSKNLRLIIDTKRRFKQHVATLLQRAFKPYTHTIIMN